MTTTGGRRRPQNYPDELRQKAVRMVLEVQSETGEKHGAVTRIAKQLGIGSESLRQWVSRPRSTPAGGPGRRAPMRRASPSSRPPPAPWVSWINEERIHGELDDRSPAQVEAAYYLHQSQPGAAFVLDAACLLKQWGFTGTPRGPSPRVAALAEPRRGGSLGDRGLRPRQDTRRQTTPAVGTKRRSRQGGLRCRRATRSGTRWRRRW